MRRKKCGHIVEDVIENNVIAWHIIIFNRIYGKREVCLKPMNTKPGSTQVSVFNAL